MRLCKITSYRINTIFFTLSCLLLCTGAYCTPQLVYSTFLSGSIDTSQANGIAVDTAGNIYITGFFAASNFPTTSGGYATTYSGGEYDVFVCKINPSLSGTSSLVYATYLGGNGLEESYGIAVDNSGNIYVTGFTYSTTFPTTANGYDTTFRGSTKAFISKINPSLSGASSLVYSSLLGGTSVDEGNGIAVDTAGNVYVTGYTSSYDFPITSNAYDSIMQGSDVFVTKLNPSLSGVSSLIYSTFLGGSNLDQSNGIAVGGVGNICVTGYTESSTFPTTANAYNKIFQGFQDVFVSEINPSLSGASSLVYSTFLGGIGDSTYDSGYAVAVDSAGNIYVTGYTRSTAFPVTANGYDTTFKGIAKVFVSKINPSLSGISSLVYSTFLGGESGEAGEGIAVDTGGNIYVAGYTFSTTFPTTSNAYDRTFNGADDVFITKLNPNVSGTASLLYSTYLGGNTYDVTHAMTIDHAGNVYVTGETYSTNYPTTSNAYDTTFQGSTGYNANVFVSMLQIPPPVPVPDWMLYETKEDVFKNP